MSTAYEIAALRRYGAPIQFKAQEISAKGQFRGYGAVFNNLDGNGDVIDPGAFTKTLADAMATKGTSRNRLDGQPVLFPILWQHQDKEPIGGITSAQQDSRGLAIIGQLDLDTDLGLRAYSGMKMGYLRGLSIGYDTVKSTYHTNARHLSEIKLWEISPVTFPANAEAQVEEIKSRRLPNLAQLDRQIDAVCDQLASLDHGMTDARMRFAERTLSKALQDAEDAETGWARPMARITEMLRQADREQRR